MFGKYHSTQVVIFILAKLHLEQSKEPRGQMCKEHVRPPKNYVFDGPKCNVAEKHLRGAKKKSLFSLFSVSSPFVFFLIPFRGLQEIYFHLGINPRNTLVENVKISLRKGKEKPVAFNLKTVSQEFTKRRQSKVMDQSPTHIT